MVTSAPSSILLAFANDVANDRRYLRSLQEESKAISKALLPAVEVGLLAPPVSIFNATVTDVTEAFLQPLHRDRIRIFHFGGHADGSRLLFEDETGAGTEATAGTLAAYLGQQPSLLLVFLNGCSTAAQVQQLRQAGIKAVVATTSEIEDKVAAAFAEAFYRELATRPLKAAFESAVRAVRLRWSHDPSAIFRNVARQSHAAAPDAERPWPWILHCDPRYEAWTLASERPPERRGRRWAAAALVLAAVLLVSSMLSSAETRRTVCRAPGIAAACARLGIGEVPSAAEEALWGEAARQATGAGLRAYLRRFPAGAYAEEAHRRLAACQIEKVETLAPPREQRYRLPVPPRYTPLLLTEQAARDDALVRAERDAATYCDSYRWIAQLVATEVRPGAWSCSAWEGGFVCGFDGEILCRLQDRLVTEEERCGARGGDDSSGGRGR